MESIVIFIVIFVFVYGYFKWINPHNAEPFTAHKVDEIYHKSLDIFNESKGNATYSKYKTHIPEADPVLYNDTRKMWRESRLSSNEIRKTIV